MTGKPLFANFGSLYSLGAQTQTFPVKPDFLPVIVASPIWVPSLRVEEFLKTVLGPVGIDIFELAARLGRLPALVAARGLAEGDGLALVGEGGISK